MINLVAQTEHVMDSVERRLEIASNVVCGEALSANDAGEDAAVDVDKAFYLHVVVGR